MSGFGERFRRAGYTIPKPLIEVDGKPIIAHVLDLFPNEQDVHFICNEEHLHSQDWDMAGTLKHYCPSGKIHAIAPHKLGPVNAVAQILGALDTKRPVAVSYCDFAGRWDWSGFKHFMARGQHDGAVICYTGFHPHMLANVKYAYCQTDGTDKVTAIQEKQPYTDTPMKEWASCGIYCFGSGETLAKAVHNTMKRDDLKLNGEYYVSLAYRPLLESNLDIRVFPIEKFCQWGTPEDLQEWQSQAGNVRTGRSVQQRPKMTGTTMIPLAGLGSRFAKQGYTTPKPLIEVSGKEMVLSAWEDLPQTPTNVFILRSDMPGVEEISKRISEYVPGAVIRRIDHVTEGQACTCLLGMDGIDENAPLTIGACDNGLRYNANAFSAASESDADVIIWSVRGYSGAVRHRQQYGWVDAMPNGDVKSVSVKVPLKNPQNDPVVTGAFTFKRAKDFTKCAQRMIERNGRVNGEFYVDECINDAIALGLKVKNFDVEAYLCWGTPEDLNTWNYYVDL